MTAARLIRENLPGARASRAIWLRLATGGWWTIDEILAEVDLPDEISISSVVDNMVRACYLVPRRIPRKRGQKPDPHARRSQYSVSPDCVPPPGITVQELSTALLGRTIGPARDVEPVPAATPAPAPVPPLHAVPTAPQQVSATPTVVHPWRKTWKTT